MNRCVGAVAAFLMAWSLGYAATGDSDCKERMIRDLDFIRNTFETRYAPARWKKQYAGWDLTTEVERAKQEVLRTKNLTVKKYQRILQKLFNGTKDYHVGVYFYSTESALLPFRIAGADGHYFITGIDRDKLPERSFPFETGDELLLFGGRPVQEVIDEVKRTELGDANSSTDQIFAEIFLTMRVGMLGHHVPRGPLALTLKSRKTGKVSCQQIIWDYAPESIREPVLRSLAATSEREADGITQIPLLKKKMMTPLVRHLAQLNSPQLHKEQNAIGGRESFIPPLGRVTWEASSDQPFHAYIFKHPQNGKSIGYVRIPHYTGGAVEANDFGAIIAHLERRTEALVIDQVNNPGGSVFYLYALASMLTDEPLATPRHCMSVTQEDVFGALDAQQHLERVQSDDDARKILGETLEGYPIDYQVSRFMLDFFRFVVEEWNAGHAITSPCYLYGVDFVNPHPDVRYTKPILFLINSLDISGGDFLPAILQDNKRVTLFGSRTAGAGGYVDGCRYPNPFGVAMITYTSSIAERLDANPIENLGVTPDIPYEITQKDLQENYVKYVQAVLNAVEGILQK